MAFFSKIFACFCCSQKLPEEDFSSDPILHRLSPSNIQHRFSPKRETLKTKPTLPSQTDNYSFLEAIQESQQVFSSFHSFEQFSSSFSSSYARIRLGSDDFGTISLTSKPSPSGIRSKRLQRNKSMTNLRTCSFCNTSYVDLHDDSQILVHPMELQKPTEQIQFFTQDADTAPHSTEKSDDELQASPLQEEKRTSISNLSYKKFLLSFLPKEPNQRTSFKRNRAISDADRFIKLHSNCFSPPDSLLSPSGNFYQMKHSSSYSSLFSQTNQSIGNSDYKRGTLKKYILERGRIRRCSTRFSTPRPSRSLSLDP